MNRHEGRIDNGAPTEIQLTAGYHCPTEAVDRVEFQHIIDTIKYCRWSAVFPSYIPHSSIFPWEAFLHPSNPSARQT